VPRIVLALRGRPLAIHRGLLPAPCLAFALLVLAEALESLDFSGFSGAFACVREMLAAISFPFSLVRGPLSLVRDPIALVRVPLLQLDAVLERSQLAFAHLARDLALLHRGFPFIDAPDARLPVAGPSVLLRGDDCGPAPFDRRSLALEGGRVPMQFDSRVVSLLLPEAHGFLVPRRRLVVAGRSLLVTFARPSHSTDYGVAAIRLRWPSWSAPASTDTGG
jgi:hypothetical protein